MQQRGWRNYSPPHADNPYYRKIHEVTHTQHQRERVARFSLIGFITATIAVTIIAHPLLRIDRIILLGLPPSTTSRLENRINDALHGRRLLMFPKNNVLFLDRRGIETAITRELIPKTIRIIPQWGRVLTITVTPFPIVFYWSDAGTIYSVNRKGIITEQIPNVKMIQNIMTGEDSARRVQLGNAVLTAQEMDWIVSFTKQFQEVLQQMPSTLIFSISHPEIVEIEFMGKIITASIQEDPRPQILRLELIIKKGLMNNHGRIDLRFGEKIYIQ